MSTQRKKANGPRGGLQAGTRSRRGWKWDRGGLTSQPVRCRKDEWYLARAHLADNAALERAEVLLHFLSRDTLLEQRRLRLHVPHDVDTRELLGWIQTPPRATHLQLHLDDVALSDAFTDLVFQDVSERDPKCHPLANVPRWSTYQPPFPLRRVLLPNALAPLADVIDWCELRLIDRPASFEKFAKLARGTACILDPEWVTAWRLKLADLERLAGAAWLLTDLETTARVLNAAGAAETKARLHGSAHGLMSARVEYADVATRGLAMQDVVPLSTQDALGGFRMRVLTANRSWRRYADAVGWATLLSSETPWEHHHADVLSAARPVGGGEWLTTDLPWLVAGRRGPLIAPRIARHLLRMHLGAPVDDALQYWNRWEDGEVVVRDIADLTRRFAPLRAVRWASATPNLAHLGVSLHSARVPATRHTLFGTGRIDNRAVHAGLPPEPLMIFMKWLAREEREQTAWARRHLAGHIVTWQFDTADGRRFAANYDSAAVLVGPACDRVHVQLPGAGPAAEGRAADVLTLSNDEGLFGDNALAFQDTLTQHLRHIIERA